MRRTWPAIGGGVTLAPDAAVLGCWQGDPRPFYAVVLMLDDPAVERRRRTVARALHPWCALTTPWQAHLTVVACGGTAPRGLQREVFQIEIAGADSFTSAAFLAASGEALVDLRRDVLQAVAAEVDPEPVWVPHVTVGTYRWPMRVAHVADRLGSLVDLPALPTAGRLAVVEVDKRHGRLQLQT